MIAEFIIAALTSASGGIFAWLFLRKMYQKISYYKDIFAEITTSKFSELFLFFDVSRYFTIYLVLVVALPIVVLAISKDIPVAFLSFLAILFSPYIVLKLLIQQRVKKFERQLPDALMMVAGSLKSGASLSIALDGLIRESPAPLSQEFSLLVRERKLGVEMETALENMERRISLEDLSMFLSAIRISREVGGDLASTLESLADTLRRKLAMEGKIESLTAQGKLQGMVMSGLPFFLMLVLLKLEPDAMQLMFTTKLGWVFLIMILCLQSLGFLAIRKITKIDV